jgi:hypothetical protein
LLDEVMLLLNIQRMEAREEELREHKSLICTYLRNGKHRLKICSYRLADVTACQKLHVEKLILEEFMLSLRFWAVEGARLAFHVEVSIQGFTLILSSKRGV